MNDNEQLNPAYVALFGRPLSEVLFESLKPRDLQERRMLRIPTNPQTHTDKGESL